MVEGETESNRECAGEGHTNVVLKLVEAVPGADGRPAVTTLLGTQVAISWQVYMVSIPLDLQRDLWPLIQVTTLEKGECSNILGCIGHRIEVDTETQSITAPVA